MMAADLLSTGAGLIVAAVSSSWTMALGFAANDAFAVPCRRDQLTWLAYGMLGVSNDLLKGLGPLMPSFGDVLGRSYTVAGLRFSAFAIGMIVAGLVGGRVVSRLGRATPFWAGTAGLLENLWEGRPRGRA